MAATYNTQNLTGVVTGTPATAANLRMKNADDNTQDTVTPLVVGGSTSYSWWKTIYLNVTVAADNDVNNVRLFADGAISWPAGIDLYVADETPTTYVQATGIATSGDELVANHSGVTARTIFDGFITTPGSEKTVTDPNIGTGTGIASDHVILQVEVGTGGTPGNLTVETLTWRVDET